VEVVDTIVFDSSKLRILHAFVNDSPVSFQVAEANPILGSAVQVAIPLDFQKIDAEFCVRFEYEVTSESSACQWLDPAATKGGERPFLFTQCQAIHARSLLPCFDSPGVKTTYNATVKAPAWATGDDTYSL
jgi:leukotriene-A4 hydrolase